jgi:hypothetical protein
MSDITKFSGVNLPSVQALTSALRVVAADVGGASGTVILKCDKTGHWVFGADQTEIEEDSIWAVNPNSFVHGFIAWGKGEVLGEKMVGVNEPLPELSPAPAAAERGWEKQVGMTLACTNGEDEGLQARFSATSAGGKKMWAAVAIAVAEQVDKDPANCVPLVRLTSEHYMHKQYGRVYNPIANIIGWTSLEANTAFDDAELEVAASEDDAPAEGAGRRRRRVTA